MSYNSVDAAVEGCIDSYLDNYDFSSIIDSVKEAVLEDDNIPSKDNIDSVQDLAQECESRIDKLETKLDTLLDSMITVVRDSFNGRHLDPNKVSELINKLTELKD